MCLPLITAIYLLLTSTIAVFVDEAWNIDHHYALLGQPSEKTTFFHQPSSNSRASLIYTVSAKGILGAVNPRDGSVVWRQRLLTNGTNLLASHLRAGQGQETVVSGIGNNVAAWSAADGRHW